MSYQLPDQDSILSYVNTLNATAFKVGDVTFSNPQVVNGTWREQATSKNSAVRLIGVEAKGYAGRQVVLYDRLSIASLANIPGFRVMADNPATVHDLLTSIQLYTGVQFSTDDVENTAVFIDTDSKRKAVLTAKPNSLGWVGSLQVEVLQGGILLDEKVTTPDLPGLNYPTASDTDTYGAVYTYGYDFTPYFDTMINIPTGVLSGANADALVAALKAVDVSAGATLWNNTQGQTAWCLYGATVTFSGLNNPATMPTNPLYKYVVALTLAAGVTTPAGTLYLHFNDPFNPDDF